MPATLGRAEQREVDKKMVTSKGIEALRKELEKAREESAEATRLVNEGHKSYPYLEPFQIRLNNANKRFNEIQFAEARLMNSAPDRLKEERREILSRRTKAATERQETEVLIQRMEVHDLPRAKAEVESRKQTALAYAASRLFDDAATAAEAQKRAEQAGHNLAYTEREIERAKARLARATQELADIEAELQRNREAMFTA